MKKHATTRKNKTRSSKRHTLRKIGGALIANIQKNITGYVLTYDGTPTLTEVRVFIEGNFAAANYLNNPIDISAADSISAALDKVKSRKVDRLLAVTHVATENGNYENKIKIGNINHKYTGIKNVDEIVVITNWAIRNHADNLRTYFASLYQNAADKLNDAAKLDQINTAINKVINIHRINVYDDNQLPHDSNEWTNFLSMLWLPWVVPPLVSPNINISEEHFALMTMFVTTLDAVDEYTQYSSYNIQQLLLYLQINQYFAYVNLPDDITGNDDAFDVAANYVARLVKYSDKTMVAIPRAKYEYYVNLNKLNKLNKLKQNPPPVNANLKPNNANEVPTTENDPSTGANILDTSRASNLFYTNHDDSGISDNETDSNNKTNSNSNHQLNLTSNNPNAGNNKNAHVEAAWGEGSALPNNALLNNTNTAIKFMPTNEKVKLAANPNQTPDAFPRLFAPRGLAPLPDVLPTSLKRSTSLPNLYPDNNTPSTEPIKATDDSGIPRGDKSGKKGNNPRI